VSPCKYREQDSCKNRYNSYDYEQFYQYKSSVRSPRARSYVLHFIVSLLLNRAKCCGKGSAGNSTLAAKIGAGGVQVFSEHKAARFLESELLLVLQWAHVRDCFEVVVEA